MEANALVFGFVTLLFLWLNLLISVKIVDYLKKFDKNVSLSNSGFFVRGKIFKYLPIYRKTTLQEEGKVGSLYSIFYATFFLAMLSLVLGIAMVT